VLALPSASAAMLEALVIAIMGRPPHALHHALKPIIRQPRRIEMDGT